MGAGVAGIEAMDGGGVVVGNLWEGVWDFYDSYQYLNVVLVKIRFHNVLCPTR